MRVLALEPYFGGSHRAFLEDWQACSAHEWTLLTLPPRKWKWRMRHASVTFADQVGELVADGRRWDGVWCSDMLNLAEFIGLAPRAVRDLPSVAYFHENQLTYPFRYLGERDLHFGFINMTTALAADSVWFNSAFHRDDFLAALDKGLRQMPDYRLRDAVERIRARSRVEPLGVREVVPRVGRRAGPLHVLWAARWEHDKDPETFFAALGLLEQRGVAFRVSVIGEQYAESPAIFDEARERFADRIEHWGYQPSRSTYEDALRDADVIVSTAEHEFFGVSVIEAISAGAYPLLPRRLAYPEILAVDEDPEMAPFFHDGSAKGVADALATLASRLAGGDLWNGDRGRARRKVERYSWARRGTELDMSLGAVAK